MPDRRVEADRRGVAALSESITTKSGVIAPETVARPPEPVVRLATQWLPVRRGNCGKISRLERRCGVRRDPAGHAMRRQRPPQGVADLGLGPLYRLACLGAPLPVPMLVCTSI
ncbi:hypothetical protein [Methylobacterium sp. SyP6R]|uniref:hypothetical protein n=1 Tax=Methylobacterium sp. SyP6R TaxID=2718876 RepID=UPI001F17E326|nr:hypothetical protein [Methylobacterium sp. SyP6R]MCF4128530.1 hypothetical protein [Methylobacterium sp. SyP6R]